MQHATLLVSPTIEVLKQHGAALLQLVDAGVTTARRRGVVELNDATLQRGNAMTVAMRGRCKTVCMRGKYGFGYVKCYSLLESV
jgi:hypothetical protein